MNDGATVSLSRFLQKVSLDLKRATDALKDTMAVLLRKRENANKHFHDLFVEAQELARKLDTEIKAPRTVSRQTHRANQPATDEEEYFRRTVYIPLLDSITTDLQNRLSTDTLNLFGLGIFMPKSEYTEEDLLNVKKAAEFYNNYLGVPASTVVTEYQLWVLKWKRELAESSSKVPSCVPSTIEVCDSDLYPNIYILLKILATLPISAAIAERSFSTLRRLKTWLRASMSEERLTGLALPNIHPEKTPDVSKILTRFSKTNRRLPFSL